MLLWDGTSEEADIDQAAAAAIAGHAQWRRRTDVDSSGRHPSTNTIAPAKPNVSSSEVNRQMSQPTEHLITDDDSRGNQRVRVQQTDKGMTFLSLD